MNSLERAVWAAAFVAEWHKERELQRLHGIPPADGFSCAELADDAVQKLREAFECDDAEHLLPVKENDIP